ncbi:nucleoside phosphorylase [Halococcoides cellulosivorans]|uniref:Uridine phosphorylase n=1 Tax=Halococcoides cellulosivorans TaxID=1679096 RepID=A0A2R4WZU6_9EURY|nr:nucleoside phosphorylase [Halococcoides cellulosivorans]AWB27049.1 uridine phosphorylase [Halococcoides cellulosivorans]
MPTAAHLRVDPGDCADIALLPGDPDRVDRIAAHLDDRTDLAANREYRLVDGTYDGRRVTVCSTGIGSPSAAIAVEELASVGVETVVRVGTIGALQADIATGDLIVPTAAAKDEGTTKRYESATIPAVATPAIATSIAQVATATDATAHVGPIVTDDAFYAEGDDYVADWEAAGLLGVEMEAAAIFTLARRRGLSAGAICAVDGNLVAGTQKGTDEDSDDELPDAAREGVDREIQVALDALSEL